VPARKKQPTDAEATAATGRTRKPAAKKPAAPRGKKAAADGAPVAEPAARPNGAARG
jgi:hypothetical protein